MIKRVLLSGLAGSVLIAGLASCTKKNVTEDVYRPPAPEFVSSSGKTRASGETLDLRDRFDVSRAAPASLEIKGACTHNDVSLPVDKTFNGETSFPILRILPEGFLTEDLKTTPASCNFDVYLTNSFHSLHVLQIENFRVQETEPSAIQFGYDNNKNPLPILKRTSLQNLRLRYQTVLPAEASVQCETFRLSPLKFTGAEYFDLFDFDHPEVKAQPTKVVDNCRILITEDHKLSAVSGLFQMNFHPAPTLDEEPQALSPDSASILWSQYLQGGRPYPIGQFHFSNSESFPRYFRSGKKIYAADAYSGPDLFHYSADVQSDTAAIVAGGERPTWRVDAKQSVSLSIVVDPHENGKDMYANVRTQLFQMTEPLTFEELDRAGHVVDRFTIPFKTCHLVCLARPETGQALINLKKITRDDCE